MGLLSHGVLGAISDLLAAPLPPSDPLEPGTLDLPFLTPARTLMLQPVHAPRELKSSSGKSSAG
jgi:hypothetical protein